MDRLSKKQRSALMSRIRSENTKPELVVRSLLHRLGYRFRLHASDLPGRPDVVFRKQQKIVMVQGCFWHGHTCSLASRPKSNQQSWTVKLKRNRNRDRAVLRALRSGGWSVLQIWECEVRADKFLADKLKAFMEGTEDRTA
jgi:DNA mismatch endonuclease (patch repair protein)